MIEFSNTKRLIHLVSLSLRNKISSLFLLSQNEYFIHQVLHICSNSCANWSRDARFFIRTFPRWHGSISMALSHFFSFSIRSNFGPASNNFRTTLLETHRKTHKNLYNPFIANINMLTNFHSYTNFYLIVCDTIITRENKYIKKKTC